jgi:hypothetical protein
MKPNYVTEKPTSFDWEEIGFSVFILYTIYIFSLHNTAFRNT